jgi:hypothetical protein
MRHRAALALCLLAVAGCAPAARMCAAAADCAGKSSCVAGRCVAPGAAVAISTARRMLYDPTEIGYVHRGGGDAERPAIAALGRGDGALAFLRFSVSLPPEAAVIEAYLLLDRLPDVDSDLQAVALHVVRLIDPWDARSLSWAVQPRIEEVGSPVTRVLPASGELVRLDVRAIVERWRRRGGTDFGLAIVAEASGSSASSGGGASASSADGRNRGMAFALSPFSREREDGQPAGRAAGAADGARGAPGPRLELYVR